MGYPDDLNGYRLIYPSIYYLIIEHNVQFEESPWHASPVQHADTIVLPSILDIRDDDSIHLHATYSYSENYVPRVD
jgi:hypothetical protein